METFGPLDGALLIDKPVGPTSHDVVDAVRTQFGLKKVGHCGTLDPNATGLLVLVLGKATKLAEQLLADDKLYAGTIKFGITTDTFDADGQVIATAPVPPLTVAHLNQLAQHFTGDLLQTPPMVSAVKKGGVPLYKLARRGLEVPRQPKLVHIYSFSFTDYQQPLGYFSVACTKGTYVRSLAHDLGQKLGCGAHLHTLRRLRSGDFTLDQAIAFETVVKLSVVDLQPWIIPMAKLLERRLISARVPG